MSFYSLLSFFSFIVCVYVGIYVLLLNSRAKLNIIFFIISVLIAIWDFGYIFIYPEPNAEISKCWYKVTAIGWSTFVSFTIHFMILLSKNKKLLNSYVFLFFLYAPALVFLIKAMFGGFLAHDFEFRNGLAYEIMNDKDPWYFAFISYYWIYLFFGIYHLRLYSKKTNINKERIQANIIIYTVLLLVLFSTATNILFPALKIQSIPAIAQILITSWMFAIYYSIVKYKLMKITAEAAVAEIITEMNELLFFIDKDKRVIKINKFTEETLEKKFKLNDVFENYFVEKSTINNILDKALFEKYSVCEDLTLIANNIKIPVRLNITSLVDKYNDNFGCIAVGQDIRDTIRLKAEVEERIKTEKELKLKNRQITDSITYARKIQESLLPSWDEITKISNENFVLYKPKDLVSGDFYWSAIKENYYFLAVVDCTGHGVPGAFMSIVANSLLSEIVEEKDIYSTEEILTKLNELLFKKLNYKTDDEFYENDGLEISLIRIDKEKKEITFSGTNQTVLIVEDGKLTELEGDIYSIGSCYFKQNITYKKEIYHYKNDIVLYLFSDGYYDQLGGANKKKIGFNNLKNMILNNSYHTLTEQRNKLLDYHYSWKGGNMQTDDMLIIGIKLYK